MLSGQESNLKIQEIGGLFADNKIGYDGGLTNLKLKILKEKIHFKSNKVKLKGQISTLNDQPVSSIEIFLGYCNEEDKLVIIDTLYTFDLDEGITLFNRKRLNENVDGIFRLKTKLCEEYAIYISSPGSHLLEIKMDK